MGNVWTGRVMNSLEPDIHKFGSIKKKMHQGVRKPSSFLILPVGGGCIERNVNQVRKRCDVAEAPEISVLASHQNVRLALHRESRYQAG
jgi:uridylate kinase